MLSVRKLPDDSATDWMPMADDDTDRWWDSLAGRAENQRRDRLGRAVREVIESRQTTRHALRPSERLPALKERILQAAWRARRSQRWAQWRPWAAAAGLSVVALMAGTQLGERPVRTTSDPTETVVMLAAGELAAYRGSQQPAALVVTDAERRVGELTRALLEAGAPFVVRYRPAMAEWLVEVEASATTLDDVAGALQPLGLTVPASGRVAVTIRGATSPR